LGSRVCCRITPDTLSELVRVAKVSQSDLKLLTRLRTVWEKEAELENKPLDNAGGLKIFFLPRQLVPPHVEMAGMAAVNQLLGHTPGLKVWWYGVYWAHRWEFYGVLRQLWGKAIDDVASSCCTGTVTGRRVQHFQFFLPQFYKYRVMTLDSFLAVMNWLGWTKDKEYFCDAQEEGVTVYSLPGIEHHVSFCWTNTVASSFDAISVSDVSGTELSSTQWHCIVLVVR
jgi:hypothetical protein